MTSRIPLHCCRRANPVIPSTGSKRLGAARRICCRTLRLLPQVYRIGDTQTFILITVGVDRTVGFDQITAFVIIYRSERGYLTMRNRRNVFPTIISSPSFSGCRVPGDSLFPRLINVPLVDPRSSRKYLPSLNVIRAWRREIFASGSSESRSTSGKTPPSASHRPISDSAALKRNCLPTDLPRSIISFARDLSAEPTDDERLTAVALLLDATSGWGIWDGDREPFCPSCSARSKPAPGGSVTAFGRELGPKFGLKAAPHSSQYWAPSRFSVLHLSHVIIGFGTLRLAPNPLNSQFVR